MSSFREAGHDSVLFQYSRWGFHFASNIYMHVNSTGYHMVPMALTSLTSNQATFRGFSTTYAGDALVERDFHLVGNPPVLRVDTRVWNTSNNAADVRSFEFLQPAHGDYYGGQYNYSDRDVIRTNSVSIGEARFPWALGTMALGVVGTNGRVSAAHGSGLWGASDVDVHFASEPWDPEGLHTYNYMIAGYDGVIRPGGYRTSSTFYALVMPEGDARRRVELAMTATSNARFRITQALPLLLELETRSGIRWRVESSDNLGEDWQAVFELETADYMTRFPDPRPTASHRFFRAVRVD